MNQAINELPVTKEEDEAMDALCRLATGRPLLEINPTTQDILNNIAIPQPSAESLHKPEPQSQLCPEAIIDEMMAHISISLKLLLTVINQTKAQPNTTPPEGDQSLQECVSTTLQQADWFREMFEDAIENQVGDVSSSIDDRVDAFFSHSFSIDDYVDVDSIVRDKVDDELEEIVEDKLANLVSEKLSNLRITFD
jgi:hypothetical protein